MSRAGAILGGLAVGITAALVIDIFGRDWLNTPQRNLVGTVVTGIAVFVAAFRAMTGGRGPAAAAGGTPGGSGGTAAAGDLSAAARLGVAALAGLAGAGVGWAILAGVAARWV